MSIYMKITVPEPITLRVPLPGGQTREVPYSFTEFLTDRAGDPVFGQDVDALESREAVLKAIQGVYPGDVIELRRGDYARLVQAATRPANPYQPIVGGQLLPYIYLIKDASPA